MRRLLIKYGLTFETEPNGSIKLKTSSKTLENFLYILTGPTREVQRLIDTIELAVNYDNDVKYEDKEWHQVAGISIYSGIIHNNRTFEVFLNDKYEETREIFPLFEIYGIVLYLVDQIYASKK